MWRGLSLLAARQVGAMARNRAALVAAWTSVGLVGAAGGAFLVAAAHAAIAEAHGTIIAHLAVAGGLFALAAVMALATVLWRRRMRRRDALAATALMVAPAVAPTALRAIAANPAVSATVVAGAAALGAAVAHQMNKDTGA
jgi:FtsH-binding integral membrane protein